MTQIRAFTSVGWVALVAAVLAAASCSGWRDRSEHRTFDQPEAAVRSLIEAAKSEDLNAIVALFGAGGQELLDSSDPPTARQNRQVFLAAVAEGWRLVDQSNGGKVLEIGNEGWPFPVPLINDGGRWRFDTAAGKEEVLARRIGRNELATIRICQSYVAAQRIYARGGHDGKRAGLFAQTFRSDPGRYNGLYWRAGKGEKRSPLGDLVAQAAEGGTLLDKGGAQPSPFHGYYFRILTAQGAAARGGRTDYIVNGEMSKGFALVAWPAQYDVTGVMTFIVNHEGVVREKDLGPETDTAARHMKLYDPDASWIPVNQ